MRECAHAAHWIIDRVVARLDLLLDGDEGVIDSDNVNVGLVGGSAHDKAVCISWKEEENHGEKPGKHERQREA